MQYNEQQILNPEGFQESISEINARLLSEIPWLDRAYGICETRLRHYERKYERDNIRFPAVLGASGDYIDLFPNEDIGNFSFWNIKDRDESLKKVGRTVLQNGMFKLIFWFSFDKIYGADANKYNIENVKQDVFSFFEKSGFVKSNVQLTNCLTEAERIYYPWDYREIENQSLMRPFGAFAVEGIIRTLRYHCYPIITSINPPVISGNLSLGSTLTAVEGTWENYDTISGQWYRDSAPIVGETSLTYQITLDDSGATIVYTEMATGEYGNKTVNSNELVVETFTAPSINIAPSIAGSNGLGDTLTATPGTWLGNPEPDTVTGQWRRDGIAIAGETGLTYVITADDSGAVIDYLES